MALSLRSASAQTADTRQGLEGAFPPNTLFTHVRTEKGRDITEEFDGSPGAVTAAADPEDTEAQVDEAREVRQNDARVCGLGLNKDIRSASVPRLRRRSCPAGSRARSRAMLSTPCG